MNHRFIKYFAYLGVIASVVNITLIVILDLTTPNYNFIKQYVSEYGIVPGSTSTIISAWWILYGISLMLFSICLNKIIAKSGRFSIAGPLFIALYGLLDSTGSSIFPMDAEGSIMSFNGMMHIALSFIGITAIIFSPILLISRIKKDQKWRPLVLFAWIIQILFFIIYILCILEFSGIFLTGLLGLSQRIFILAADIWIAVLSIRAIREVSNKFSK